LLGPARLRNLKLPLNYESLAGKCKSKDVSEP
jgi:hypothetical protein